MSGGEERLTVRVDDDLAGDLNALADAADTTVSDLLRKGAAFVVESQGDRLERQGELIEQERQQVAQNQKRRNIARFPSTVRDLMLEDLKADVDPAKLPMLAEGYRRQARTKEELAQELDGEPVVEPGELVAAVDQELRWALEAADLSTWYDGHQNPYAADLSGVEDGLEERNDLAALVASVVEDHGALCRAFRDPADAPAIDPLDLPPMASDLLPDDVTREDVADLATRLARQGVTGDQVRRALDGGTWPDPIDVTSHDPETDTQGDTEPDPPVATLRTGGVPLDATPDDESSDPISVEAGAETASELQQAELQQSITAADGGRTPSARSSGFGTETETEEVEDTPMTDHTHTDTDDSEEQTETEDVTERLEALDAATARAAGDTDE